MSSKRWIFFGAVAVVLAVGFSSWRVRTENEELQTRLATVGRGASRLVRDRAELQAEVQRAHEQTATIEKELAAVRQELAERMERGGPINAVMVQRWLTAANDPAVMRRLNLEARYQTLRHYGDLFDRLKLEPADEARLTILLADKRQSAVDVVVAAFQRGEDLSFEPGRYRQIVAVANAQIEKEINGLLGDEKYAQYRNYDTSIAQANMLRNLELSLRGVPEALTSEQSERIKELLQESGDARLTAETLEAAKTFLAPQQFQVLQDLRAVQVADEQKRIQRLQFALTPLPSDPVDN